MPEPQHRRPLTRAERRAWSGRPRRDAAANAAESPARQRRPRSRTLRWIGWALGAVALLVLAVPMILAVPAVNEAFPARTAVECRVGDPREVRTIGRARLSRAKFVPTDCGVFRVTKQRQAVCASDPTRDVQLVQGTRYDLVVRGPDIPILTAPHVVSAVISADQGPPGHSRFAELDAMADALLEELDPDDRAKIEAQSAENLAGLEAYEQQFAPETLRAFDYAQPPFDPQCDASRRVMTTIGVQIMGPQRAAELLIVPEGETPRAPLLPCDGPYCTLEPTPQRR